MVDQRWAVDLADWYASIGAYRAAVYLYRVVGRRPPWRWRLRACLPWLG